MLVEDALLVQKFQLEESHRYREEGLGGRPAAP